MSPPAQGLMLALRSASADLALTSSPPVAVIQPQNSLTARQVPYLAPW